MKIKVWSKERGAKILKDGVDFASYQAKYPSAIKVRCFPSAATMERWHSEGGCKAVDGCWVEPDGECAHSFPSWLSALGFI